MLWMVRAFPGNEDRKDTFLQKNIIAVHWGIGDLTGCNTKEDIARVVDQANLKPRDASLKIGLLNRFVNQMKIGDYCIVPYEDGFYSAVINSDYYFDPNSKKFEHQRKVEWLFGGESFNREELPKQLQLSIKSQLGLANISKNEADFVKYVNEKQGIDVEGEGLENGSVVAELDLMVVDALNILKEEMNSDDPHRRLQAATAIMELSISTNK